MSNFNIEHIRSLSNRPQYVKTQSYKKIQEQIQLMVKNRATQGYYELTYEIPTFILGYPPYSLKDCSAYLYNKFKEQGFHTSIYRKKNEKNTENDIYYIKISWIKNNESTLNKKIIHPSNNNNQKINFYHQNGYLDSIPINPSNTNKISLYL